MQVILIFYAPHIRYEEEEQLKTEQEEWEEEQVKKSSVSFGAKDRKKAGDEYDFVVEDQIEFVSDMVKDAVSKDALYAEADDTDEEEESRLRHLSAHEKILEGRKKLPVYAYREEFLAAVRDNNVLIIVRFLYSHLYLLKSIIV